MPPTTAAGPVRGAAAGPGTSLAIRTRGLTKDFRASGLANRLRTGGLARRAAPITALDSLDLDVRAGEVLGLLGPNGAGKTTTIRLLLGLIHPASGFAEIFGLDAQADKVAVHARAAYVPGEATLWPSLTGAETLELLARLQGQTDLAYRSELIRRFDLNTSMRIRAYSKGNRQKVSLIAALASRADLLILDEPTAGLDPVMEQAFRASIREAAERGQTVFLSSHVLSEVEALCDRVAILRRGRLVEIGTLAQLRHLSALTVQATFPGQPPDVTGIAGVSAVTVTGRQLSCQVRGPIGDLLAVLAAARPDSLLSREPSLEELFLTIYGDPQDAPAEAGDDETGDG